jgi:hypothetical protein
MHETDIVMGIAEEFQWISHHCFVSLSLLGAFSSEGGGEKRFQGRGLAIQLERDNPPQAPPSEKFVSKNVSKNFVLVLGDFLGRAT